MHFLAQAYTSRDAQLQPSCLGVGNHALCEKRKMAYLSYCQSERSEALQGNADYMWPDSISHRTLCLTDIEHRKARTHTHRETSRERIRGCAWRCQKTATALQRARRYPAGITQHCYHTTMPACGLTVRANCVNQSLAGQDADLVTLVLHLDQSCHLPSLSVTQSQLQLWPPWP